MKILSYNIRGLGSRAKSRDIRELIRSHGVDFCCIQETKKENIDEFLGKSVWGDGRFGWAFREAEGRSGGILSIWNSDLFVAVSCWHMKGAAIVNGLWRSERINCCIVNIYAPCPLNERIELWDRLQIIISQNQSSCLCIAGNFNSIRRESERNGRRSSSCKRDITAFDEFIRNTGVVDLPLHRRLYTWYKPDGSCRSRIDRILVNSLWMSQWPNVVQKGLRRSISDHFPILLEVMEFVISKWGSYEVEGWGGFVLKEKLKRLKADIKKWNKEVFGMIDEKIEKRKQVILKLDMIDETLGLKENEISLRNEERARLFQDMKSKDSFIFQKARCKWIKEGDANTRFFHKYINKRRKRNEISGVMVEG
ncbi:hypothetical protein ACS0TY_014579 [Phlomoides rotata]